MALILLHTGEMFEGGYTGLRSPPRLFLFQKIFRREVVICGFFVRCWVKGAMIPIVFSTEKQ